MAAQLYSGIKSLHLQLDTPYDLIRTDDIRDDLSAVKVWISETSGFIPGASGSTLVFDGLSLSITISDLEVNKQYFVKYAFISKIDPNTYTVSAQLTQTVYDENVRIYGYLTNSPTSVATDADGNGGDFSTATGIFKVFDLGQDVTGAGPVYSIKPGSNNSVTGASINSTTGVYTCTGTSSSTASVTFLATYNNIVVEQVWNVYKGLAGSSSPIIQISATNNSFVFKDEFAATPITAETTITATLKNIDGVPTFTTKAYTREGLELGTGNTQIQFTQSGDSITITGTQFAALGVNLGTVIVTATVGEISDSYTLYRINDGTEQITVELSNSSHVIPAANDGSTILANYIGSGTIIKVKQGNTYLKVDSASPYDSLGTWIVTTIDSTNITCDPTPTIGSDYINYDTHAAMTADSAYIDYTISYITTTGAAGTSTVRQSFAKSKEGAKAISVVLSSEAHVFPANTDGSVSSYANSGTEIRVYEGAGLLQYDGVGTSNGTWKVQPTGTNISVGDISDSGAYATAAQHSGVASGVDTSSITYTITGKNSQGAVFSLVKTQTFSKSKTGVTGPSVRLIDINGITNFSVNAGGAFSPSSATLTAVLTNISDPTYSWSVTNATPTTGTGSSITIAPNQGVNNVTVTLQVSGAGFSTLSKTVIMAVAYAGQPGQAGQNGVQSAYPTIYQWTGSSTAPARPTVSSTYTWATGSYTAPSDWSTTAPSNTSPGQYLWEITVPLATSATTATSTLDWNNSSYPIRNTAYNGVNGSQGPAGSSGNDGSPGSAAYIVTRTANDGSAPSYSETLQAVGRGPIVGDIAVINYNNGNDSTQYRYTASGYITQSRYITGSLIVQNTITAQNIAANTIVAGSAIIQDGAITNAKIGNLQVDMLKIADQSVTVQATASGAGSVATSVTVPSGVVGSIYAVVTKLASVGGSSGSNDPIDLSLNIAGAVRTAPILKNYYNPGGGDAVAQYFPTTTLAGTTANLQPGTYTISASFSLGDNLVLAVFASWK